MLQVFSGYDHPASRIAILLSIPWIVKSQNRDGSWGVGERRDATTAAVVTALMRVCEELPEIIGDWAQWSQLNGRSRRSKRSAEHAFRT